MQKCGWTHCNCGGFIYDNQEKTKVGKRWYHKECADERDTINEIITVFTEQVNSDIEMSVLRKVVNDIIYNENRPAKYVLFAVNYAITHPVMKLTYPQGLYRVCHSKDVVDAWVAQQNKVFMQNLDPSSFIAKDVKGEAQTPKKNTPSGFGKVLGRRADG